MLGVSSFLGPIHFSLACSSINTAFLALLSCCSFFNPKPPEKASARHTIIQPSINMLFSIGPMGLTLAVFGTLGTAITLGHGPVCVQSTPTTTTYTTSYSAYGTILPTVVTTTTLVSVSRDCPKTTPSTTVTVTVSPPAATFCPSLKECHPPPCTVTSTVRRLCNLNCCPRASTSTITTTTEACPTCRTGCDVVYITQTIC